MELSKLLSHTQSCLYCISFYVLMHHLQCTGHHALPFIALLYRISDGKVTVELQELLHCGHLLLLDCHVKTSETKLWIVHG